MASHNNLCKDLQYLIEKIEVLIQLPGAEAYICAEDREELDRIWADQALRGMCIKQPKAMT